MKFNKNINIILTALLLMTIGCSGKKDRIFKNNAADPDILYSHVDPLEWQNGMEMGVGLDSIDLKLKTASNALDFDTEDPDMLHDPVCYNERKFDFKFVESREELEIELGINVTAKIDVIVATAEGRVDFIKNVRFNKKNVYMLIQDYRKNCDFRIKNPKLTEEAENLYSSDYELFRKKYGDKFCNVITTGGRFYGLIEIEAKSEKHKEQIKIGLKAKVFGATVFSYKFKKVIRDITDPKGVSGKIFVESNGGVFNIGAGEFFEKYKEYLENINSASCLGNSKMGYKECHYTLGRFEDYDLATRKKRNGSIKNKISVLDRLSARAKKFEILKYKIKEVKDQPDLYNIISEKTDSKSQIIDGLENEINDCFSLIEDKYNNCKKNNVCDDSFLDTMTTPLQIEKKLPQRKDVLPSTCLELKEKYKYSDDGEYTIYLNSDYNKPYRIYCSGMEKQNPEDYLPLKNISPNTVNPSYNFSQYRNIGLANSQDTGTLTTVYRKLKVKIYDNFITVVPVQKLFIENNGGLFEKCNYNINKCQVAAYANPESINDFRKELSANINLEDTPFKIDDELNFIKISDSSDTCKSDIIITDNRKNISMKLAAGKKRCSIDYTEHNINGLKLIYSEE